MKNAQEIAVVISVVYGAIPVYEAPTTRIRRGKVVSIPEEWRGKITHKQTIRKRKSKLINKRKREYN